DRVGRGDRGDQRSGGARTRDLSDRDGELDLGVSVDEVVALDQRREIRLVRDVEEHGEDPDHELDGEELPDLENAERPEDRDEEEENGAGRVADDEDAATVQAVDPDTGWQREEDERQEAEDAEDGELEGRRVQLVEREERDRELRDLRTELA